MKKFVLITALVFAGCSNLPKYVEPPASSSPSTVSNYSNLLLCKLTGIKGPDGYNACQARILVIDGSVAPNVSQLKIQPGIRQIRTFCHIINFTYIPPGEVRPPMPDKSHSQNYEVEFIKGMAYKVEPFWDGSHCKIRLIDTSGNELQMKDVLNPIST